MSDTAHEFERWGPRVASDALRFDPALHTVAAHALPHRGEWKHFRELTMAMARSELKQRYFGSVLGYVWTLLRPLMLFGVLYFVFTHIVRVGGDVKNYPLYLLMSLVLWNYFAETTTIGVTSLVQREGIMRKISFPRIAIPFSLALTTGFHLATNLVVVVVFILASGITPTLEWLMAVPLIAAYMAFTVATAMLLSTIYVRVRDLQPIWEVGAQLLFWASPVIYVATFPTNDTVQKILGSSPISATFSSLRHWVIDPSAPGAAGVLGGREWLLIPISIAVIVTAAGFMLFNRFAPHVAEDL